MAFHNGHFLAAAGWAEGLDKVDYAKGDGRWRAGSMYDGTERLERKQVDLCRDRWTGGGEKGVMSAVIHVTHVKREGEPKRNTRVENGYFSCAKVIELCLVIITQYVCVINLLCCAKFQSCDIFRYPRVRREREIDGSLKVRCYYTHVSPSGYVNQSMDRKIRCACIRASNDLNAKLFLKK